MDRTPLNAAVLLSPRAACSALNRCTVKVDSEWLGVCARPYAACALPCGSQIQQQALHISKHEEMLERLSEHERTFLEGYLQLYQDHGARRS